MRTIVILLLTLCAVSVLAQTKEQKSAADLPAQVEIKGEQFKELKLTELRARLAEADVNTLDARIQAGLLQIQQAQQNLQTLKQKAADEKAKHQTKLAELSKIPSEQLADYEPDEKEDTLVLKRKPKK